MISIIHDMHGSNITTHQTFIRSFRKEREREGDHSFCSSGPQLIPKRGHPLNTRMEHHCS